MDEAKRQNGGCSRGECLQSVCVLERTKLSQMKGVPLSLYLRSLPLSLRQSGVRSLAHQLNDFSGVGRSLSAATL